jgi:type I restriction enzyme, S subunit
MKPSFVTDHLDIWTSAIEKKSTSSRGSNGKISLYGIKKLRELILELAVRGKLVPQDPNDESASVLLEKIATEKERLIKEKKIKKPKKLPEIDSEDKPFDLPKSWQWQRLSEIGIVASSSRVHQKDWTKSGIPFYRAREIVQLSKNGFVNNELFISEEHFKLLSSKGFVPEANDMMITGVGTIGEPYVVKKSDKFYFKDASVLIFKNIYKVTPKFLFYFFKSPFWIKAIHEGSMGTTVHTLTISRANVIPVPVPPESEQHRIVAKVDELMSLCDQLEQQTEESITAHQTLVETLLDTLTQSQNAEELTQNWNRISDHFDTLFTTEFSIDQLKQIILQLAVMGKLVPQDPNDEPASILLEKIAAEKEQLVKEGKIKKQKALPEISDDEKPFDLPDGWEWARVWDVAMLITSGSRDWAKYYASKGAIFITMGNLSRGDYRLRMDNIRFVDPPKGSEGSRTKLEENDLVISITGDVGNLGLIPNNFGEAYINQHSCLLRFMPEYRNKYFPELMRSPWAKYQFDAPQRGIKNSFRLGDVGEMIVPIPPEPEQHRIISKIDELMRTCEKLSHDIGVIQKSINQLANAIVKQTSL